VLKEFQMLQKQLHNINAKDPNEKIDWNDTKVMSANGYQKTGTHSTQNATDTIGRQMATDFFEDDGIDPRSTTQGKTSTAFNMDADYDAHFTLKDAEKIKGIAARY
jgi:hypothetical protein